MCLFIFIYVLQSEAVQSLEAELAQEESPIDICVYVYIYVCICVCVCMGAIVPSDPRSLAQAPARLSSFCVCARVPFCI